MEWNIVAEYISLVILAIIWVYARKGSHLPTLKNKTFQGCLIITFCSILMNILSTTMIYHYAEIPLTLTWIVTSIYFVLTPLMGLTYFCYILSVIYAEPQQFKKTLGIGMLPAIGYIGLVIFNPWTKNLFDLNMSQGYSRGDLISITYIIFYFYCLTSIIVTLLNAKYIDRSIYKILAAFPVLAVIVIVIQQIEPNVILSGSAATCALLIIYLHLQNKQITLDYLTNMPNRQELLNMLAFMLKKTPDKNFVLLVLSLRDFRQVNNTYGQQKGDAFLKQMSQFLKQVGPLENVYRFGGDEFALLYNEGESSMIKQCLKSIEERMQQPWQIDNYSLYLSVVIGIVSHREQGETLEKMINAIEYAVYQAKRENNGFICYCDQEMLAQLERKNQIIDILKEKLSTKSFEMYYQPIYTVETQDFQYAESLMRIPDSPIGPIYPSEFIPIAEETGLIVEMTYVLLEKVCQFIKSMLNKGIQLGSIHVNFSGTQFSQTDLLEKVLKIVNSYDIPFSTIKIEFTESTLAESSHVVTEFALEMMKHGIKMGLDDFGTGYSNIATVIRIPFGTIKLDKSLVDASMKNQKSATAIRNLTNTFKELGMKVIAEGVETEEQKQLMIDFGVDQIQGFYFAKPMTAEDMEKFMLTHKK